MKKQLTALFALASMGWTATTFANDLQASQLQSVNNAIVLLEINLEQPELNIELSIINQVNETLQQQSKNNASMLIALESELKPNQEANTRTE